MAKEIVPGDIVHIQALLQTVLGTGEYAALSRMGGLTNRTYQVTMEDGAQYVARIPGEGTEEMIRRGDERISTRLACDLGVDSPLLYFGTDGSKLSRYIPNAVTMSAETLRNAEHVEQAARLLRVLHTCGMDTGVPFEVFDMAQSYEKIIFDKGLSMYEDHTSIKAAVMAIKQEVDRLCPVKKVPCHNDPLCENWVLGDGRLYLIDWEYAGMNDAMWDLADVSIEAGFDETLDRTLLSAYLNREPSAIEQKHFLANKIYVDYLWTLWAKARVPYDGQPMEDWALERYTRLKQWLQQYQKTL